MSTLSRTLLHLFVLVPALAHPADLSLGKINAYFVQTKLALPGVNLDDSAMEAMSQPGCNQGKVFSFYRNGASLKIAIALCEGGELGPQKYQVTIDENLKPFIPKEEYVGKRAEEAKLIYGTTIPLSGNRTGRLFWMPLIGHGLLLMPTAIAPSRDGKVTILIQSDLDIEQNRNVLENFANLLRAVDAEL